MANKDNQSKEYRIYIKESKSWVDVNKEFYTNYYRDINAYRKRQQEHGRCVCPASKLYAKLNELDPEGRLICQLIMQGKSERDCGKEMGLSRNTFVYRRDKLFKKLRSELKDYI